MPIDPKLTQRALRRVARLKTSVQDLSDWESEFLGSLEDRLGTYGKAFSDPDKGAMSAPLSLRQGLKLKEISGKKKPAAALEKVQDTPKPRKARKPLTRHKTFSSRWRTSNSSGTSESD